ncbi:hypothetical protein FB45DRAFT_6251 [Roridomyces roridus]|uniref:Uncharacterized protein n=1 Tax=Roridomyces roridus TaxID=1738132 RepID=A0AAD7CIL4_9AGAR|nr:hypothetical protein FB45DRAFT_6251 [Roridomyces roridus]
MMHEGDVPASLAIQTQPSLDEPIACPALVTDIAIPDLSLKVIRLPDAIVPRPMGATNDRGWPRRYQLNGAPCSRWVSWLLWKGNAGRPRRHILTGDSLSGQISNRTGRENDLRFSKQASDGISLHREPGLFRSSWHVGRRCPSLRSLHYLEAGGLLHPTRTLPALFSLSPLNPSSPDGTLRWPKITLIHRGLARSSICCPFFLLAGRPTFLVVRSASKSVLRNSCFRRHRHCLDGSTHSISFRMETIMSRSPLANVRDETFPTDLFGHIPPSDSRAQTLSVPMDVPGIVPSIGCMIS